MKFTKILAAVLCIAAVATACQQPFEEPSTEQGKAINLSVDVDNFTKATDTAFEDGDQIGLHIVPSGVFLNNAKYTYTAGALVGEQTNYWYMDETTVSDIYAYYPYNENGTYKAAGYTFTVNADQNKVGGYAASDLMVAHTTSKPTAEAIELPFRHALSKVVIKIDNQLEEEIKDVYFSDVYGTATVRFNEVASTVSGSKGTIKAAKVTVAGEQAYALIVVPQENVSPKLIITTENKQYTYQLAGNISFSAGKVSTAEITVSDESISTAFTPTISDWVGDNDLQFGQGEGFEGGGNEGGNTGGNTGDGHTVYFHPNMWNVDGAWFSAHVWGGGDQDITLTDNDGDGVYEFVVPAGTTGLLFCRMDPAVSSFSWETGIWNQTVDLTLGLAPNNHFHITAWDNGEWHDENYVYDNSGVASGLGVIGSFPASSGWTVDMPLNTTDSGILVAKNITFNAYDSFKIRTVGTWDDGNVNMGSGEVNYFTPNSYFTAVDHGGDITVAQAGTYDIYFNQSSGDVYIMTAGTPYTSATKQTTSGPAPDASTMKWGLAGEHNGWAAPDTALVWDGTIGLYVAKNATLSGEFKVRADESWNTNFGSGGQVGVNNASATAVYNNGNNCSVSAGTYDVYFWFDATNIKANGKLWVKTPGSAAPSL